MTSGGATATMGIESVPEWALGPREAEVAGLLARCFDEGPGGGFGGRSFYHQRHHLRLLARQGEALVGHVAIGWRAVRLGEALVDIAGLAEVATAPEARGRGVAKALVARSIEEARGSLADHLLLFGDPAVYGSSGFRPARNPIRHVVMAGARTWRTATARDAGLMVLPLRGAPWDADAPLDLLGPMF